MNQQKREQFISDPQKFIDYYTNQAGTGTVASVNTITPKQFGRSVSRVIPLPSRPSKPKKCVKKNIETVITSPTEAVVRRAEKQHKRNLAKKKSNDKIRLSNKKRKFKGKERDPVPTKRKRIERDLFVTLRK